MAYSETREQVAPGVVRVTGSQGRYYAITVDGVEHELPSVTTIMKCIGKPALIKWAEREGMNGAVTVAADLYADLLDGGGTLSRELFASTLQQRIPKQRASDKALAKAGEIGTHAHALVEHYLLGVLGQAGDSPKLPAAPEVAQAAKWAFDAWLTWASSVKLKPIKVEQTVYSLAHRYAGTLDLLAEVDGSLGVLDWKTGKSVYAESFLQNAAYQVAVGEMGHGNVERGIIVRLPKRLGDPEFEAVDVPERGPLFDTFRAVQVLSSWWEAAEKASAAQYHAKRRRVA